MWNTPFKKSEIKKKYHFFLVKFSHGIWGVNSYILPNFKVREQWKKKCPQFTRVGFLSGCVLRRDVNFFFFFKILTWLLVCYPLLAHDFHLQCLHCNLLLYILFFAQVLDTKAVWKNKTNRKWSFGEGISSQLHSSKFIVVVIIIIIVIVIIIIISKIVTLKSNPTLNKGSAKLVQTCIKKLKW